MVPDVLDTSVRDDPRHLVPECAECEHRDPAGICGLGLEPAAGWQKPGGCPSYAPLVLEPSGDANPDDFPGY